MKNLILHWFKIQSNKAAKQILAVHYRSDEIKEILLAYWQKYLILKQSVPKMPTMGGSIMMHLAAMSSAFYNELTTRGKSKDEATKLFFDIAWKIYVKMGKFSWLLAGIGRRNKYRRLLKATQLFRAFPFNSPSYIWQDVATENNAVGFDCTKCPVAEYFIKNDLSEFCVATWCALDYPLARLWNAELKRTGSIAGGAEKCDFRWTSLDNKKNFKSTALTEKN